MPRILIKKFGPIKNAEFETNKITVFIGNQSSGKSTIAKVISFCSWLEKEALIRQDLSFVDELFVNKQFLEFHKISSYITSQSHIEYTGELIYFKYIKSKISVGWQTLKARKEGKLAKISYIPATRNLAAMPNIEVLPVSHDNIRSFIFEWLNVRNKYTKNNKIEILNLGLSYYFDETSSMDKIIVNDNNKILPFDEVSSGVQSLTPLYILINYLMKWIYENTPDTTYEKQKTIRDAKARILRSQIKIKENQSLELEELIKLFVDEINQEIETSQYENTKIKDYFKVLKLFNEVGKIHYSHLIIEEPEQNLFPKTQRDLIYHLLGIMQNTEEDHKLVLTTHSPYILYALNNCMMGGLLDGKMDAIKDRLGVKDSLVAPANVSVMSIENGEINNIQQDDGLIGANYFEENMKELMDDFYLMLNFYDSDKK